MAKKKILVPILALVLTLFVSVGLFVACNDTGNNTNKTSYTVTFEYNNGAENTTQSVDEGNAVQKPQDPTRDGYDFAGWTLKDQTDLYDFSTPVNGDITLSATWTSALSSTARLRWDNDESYEFVFEGTTPREVQIGSSVSFGLKVSPYYTGTPVVKVGNAEIAPNGDVYSFVVEKSVSISVSGLKYDDTPMAGAGTEEDPYIITKPVHMKDVTDAINADDENMLEAFYRLGADIDFAGEKITPIGIGEYPFLGQFDGCGYTISNFQLDASKGYVGLFGLVAIGAVSNLNVEAGLVVECTNQNLGLYVIGAVVAYNMGSDITNCSFNGSIEVVSEVDPASNLIFVGGISGFTQGYNTTNTGTISYNTVHATLRSTGSKEINYMGGIVGAMTGTADSATAYVHNSVFEGSISGKVANAGGIAGALRTLSSVANCYTRGNVYAQNLQGTGEDDFASAGAIVGLAENETAVVACISDAECSTSGTAPEKEYIVGKLVGVTYPERIYGIDDRQSVLYNSYYVDGTEGQEDFEITNIEHLSGLLAWNAQEWQVVDGKVMPKYGIETSFTVTFDFGTNITFEGENGEETITQDNVVLGMYIPINWVYESSGMNVFTADNGKISYGFFLDEERTKRLPSAFMPTSDMTVYVGFEDYSPVAGEYYTSLADTDIRLVFDDNGKLTLFYKFIVAYFMYAYDGDVVIIKKANFADFVYGQISGLQGRDLSRDYYAKINANGNLTIYDTTFYAPGAPLRADVINCNKKNDAMGTWYSTDGKIYQFLGDNTVTVSNGETYLYTVSGSSVTMTSASKTIIATLSADKTQMSTSNGTTLSIKKYDEYLGTWESDFATKKVISFDGKNTVTYNEHQFSYSIDEYGVLTFENVTVFFDEDGMLNVDEGGVVTVFGREGSFIGTWSDPSYKYTIEFYGINKDGYGVGFDSNNVDFTYGLSQSSDMPMIELYYRTQMYGYGNYVHYNDAGTPEEPKPVGEFIEFAVYTQNSVGIVDDYMLAYHDVFEGEWFGEDGSAITFNGLGAYDINLSFSGYDWVLEGHVEVDVDGDGKVDGTVRYVYDKENEQAIYTYNETEYVATLTADGIMINGVAFSRADGLNTYVYTNADGSLMLQFNGRSKSNHGKVAIMAGENTTECDYTFDGTVATITYQGQPMYTATITNTQFVLSSDEGDVEMFIYHSVVGQNYILANGAFFTVDTYFSMDGVATGHFGSNKVDVVYVDEKYLIVDLGSPYYLQVIDEYTIALFENPQSGLIIASIPDGYQGVYTASNGDTLTIDGRSNSSNLIDPNAVLETADDVLEYTYSVEKCDGYDVIHIYEKVGSGDDEQPVEVYTASTKQTEGSVAYTSEGGVTLYLTAVTTA